VDHDISVVGYTTDSSRDVTKWIIRNHWGTNWGCGGFGYLTAGENTCQLTQNPAMVTVSYDGIERSEIVRDEPSIK